MLPLLLDLIINEMQCAVGGALLGRVLSEFYKSVEKLGFVAGGEFKAAVEEGELREETSHHDSWLVHIMRELLKSNHFKHGVNEFIFSMLSAYSNLCQIAVIDSTSYYATIFMSFPTLIHSSLALHKVLLALVSIFLNFFPSLLPCILCSITTCLCLRPCYRSEGSAG